ncbi:MAG: hypothetical protein F4069_03430 [Rhodothermaceae bacterium]|nr:hypothetical protein [Rhodothermaceae bacterium]MYG68687.1 hypothetical protein [Rhodothermaceae bacterium]MYJ44369.1 hypothetical protein [Rhodothermaceae bacterium]
MATIFEKNDLPDHLFNIPCLDLQEDLLADRLGGLWFLLGARTIHSQRDNLGVEDVIERQCMLLEPGHFSEVHSEIDFVGNVLHDLGKPGGYKRSKEGEEEYFYAPFHRFSLRSISCEPLVFIHQPNSNYELFINPDLQLYFELEKKSGGIWWNPRRGVTALRHKVIGYNDLQIEIVEIRVDHLRKYLQIRQRALVVGHYRHLYLFDPSSETIKTFVGEDIEQGSPTQGAKAIIQNIGPSQRLVGESYIGRRLHLWFEVQPLEIDIDDPWAEEILFDPSRFTLPTKNGPVAPDRFRVPIKGRERPYDGVTCKFMENIYFKQEVLSKYEGDSRFDIQDNGSVSCRHYWGLERSTSRVGNELLSTTIGDFAAGVPFIEWPHWKQYAVEPPSLETINALLDEPEIPSVVNQLIQELDKLNIALVKLAGVMEVVIPDPFWCGSVDSIAGRQLKWVFPITADDDEFLKRATLMSTLVIDGLVPKSLRKLCQAWGKNLHQDNYECPLGSRRLLERVTFIAMLINHLQPSIAKVPDLVKQAEKQPANGDTSDLQIELVTLIQRTQKDLAPLAFLYALRIHGGIAHPSNKKKVARAATELDLPNRDWHRTHYLQLLTLVINSVSRASDYLLTAAESA